MACTGQFRSCLRALSGFFIHRSCEGKGKPFPRANTRGWVRSAVPHPWRAGRHAGVVGTCRFAGLDGPRGSQPFSRPIAPARGRPPRSPSSSTVRVGAGIGDILPAWQVPWLQSRLSDGHARQVFEGPQGPGALSAKHVPRLPGPSLCPINKNTANTPHERFRLQGATAQAGSVHAQALTNGQK